MTEFMKTLALMEATLEAENEVQKLVTVSYFVHRPQKVFKFGAWQTVVHRCQCKQIVWANSEKDHQTAK